MLSVSVSMFKSRARKKGSTTTTTTTTTTTERGPGTRIVGGKLTEEYLFTAILSNYKFYI